MSWLEHIGVSGVHAKRIFAQVYREACLEWQEGTNLPLKLRRHWTESWCKIPLQVSRVLTSNYDGSVKFVFALEDGYEIESVLMPETSRTTVCLSTQVGCRQGCRFCHTGRMGLLRQLTTEEIVGQVMAIEAWMRRHPDWNDSHHRGSRVSNVVFMGMGEPLDNLEALIPALKIMLDPWGLGLAPRRVTVSTAGHLDGLRQLVDSGVHTAIALSLHSPFRQERSRLMPINKRFDLDDVLDFLDQVTREQNRHCLVQYTLIGGKNDTLDHARALGELLQGRAVKVNLIPFNPVDSVAFVPPEPLMVQKFRDTLSNYGLRIMVRYSKGQDIAAACGQLIRKKQTRKSVSKAAATQVSSYVSG